MKRKKSILIAKFKDGYVATEKDLMIISEAIESAQNILKKYYEDKKFKIYIEEIDCISTPHSSAESPSVPLKQDDSQQCHHEGDQ